MPIKVYFGIISTDRNNCLERLLKSIDINTHMNDRYEFFVVDDSSVEKETNRKTVEKYDWCKFYDTGNRIGIARNSNEALKRMKDLDYGFLINSDVEIKKYMWELKYTNAMIRTGLHCMCFRKLGLWGACQMGGSDSKPDVRENILGIEIAKVMDKPQGAFIVFDKEHFETVGYFNENLKSYGYSHWLWTILSGISGIQPEGFFDIGNSNDYVNVHDEKCITPQKERLDSYKRNRKIYNQILNDIKQGKMEIYNPLN